MDGPLSLPGAEARRVLVCAQGLDGNWKLPAGPEGAAQVVERLGYVQIDTIAVIERAHHHVIWTRHPGYQAAHLDDLLSRVVLEPGFTPDEVFWRALARKLHAFAAFHGCGEVLVDETQPAGARAALRRALKG
jgi:uncharacterized protein YcaQ